MITTLLDHQAYPAEEVASLYSHRWEIEVRFRDIKTTMGMEMLRTRSPEMLQKEVLVHMIAHNLMRLLMLKAGIVHGVNHRRLSFKGTMQVLEETRSGFGRVAGKPRLRAQETASLWSRIAERTVDDRPGVMNLDGSSDGQSAAVGSSGPGIPALSISAKKPRPPKSSTKSLNRVPFVLG